MGSCSSGGTENSEVLIFQYSVFETYDRDYGGAICHQGTTIVIDGYELIDSDYVRDVNTTSPKLSFLEFVYEGDTWGPCSFRSDPVNPTATATNTPIDPTATATSTATSTATATATSTPTATSTATPTGIEALIALLISILQMILASLGR